MNCPVYLRWSPHPVIVTLRDNTDYIRVLVYSCYTTITGWGSPQKVYQRKQLQYLHDLNGHVIVVGTSAGGIIQGTFANWGAYWYWMCQDNKGVALESKDPQGHTDGKTFPPANLVGCIMFFMMHFIRGKEMTARHKVGSEGIDYNC